MTVNRILERIRAEFQEMPDLQVTAGEIQRLCGVDRDECQPVLDALVDAEFLRLKADGRYTRAKK